MYPQGMLDIIHQVILENCPNLILRNCPKELLEKYPKEIIENNPEVILQNKEFRLHFKQKLPNEFNLKNGKRIIADMPLDTMENLILNLEFQSSKIKFKQKTKFNLYQAFLHNEHSKYVFTVIFSMDQEKHEIIHHKINLCDEFTMLIISLKALNRKQTLNNSNYKITNNIRMSDKEKALFLMSPAMEKENRVDTLKETIRLTQLIESVDSQEKNDLLKIQLNFADEWFTYEDWEEIRGDDMVVELSEGVKKRLERMAMEDIKENLRQEVKGEVKEEVKQEVKEEVKQEVKEEVKQEVKQEFRQEIEEDVKLEVEENIVRKLLVDGFKVDDVLKYTSLNKSQILALSNTLILK